MNKTLTKKEILKNENRVLKANQLHRLSTAHKALDRCGEDRYMGSSVTIEIKNINSSNFVIAEEFSIRDGLSQETIDAIKKDIQRSFDLAVNHPLNSVLAKSNKE